MVTKGLMIAKIGFFAEFNGKEIKIPSSKLGVQNKFDITECLLKGIAWIMTKYSISSGSQTTSKIEEVLQWAKDGKWHILEGHPQAIDEAESQLLDLLTTVRNLRKVNESVKRVLEFEWHDDNINVNVKSNFFILKLHLSLLCWQPPCHPPLPNRMMSHRLPSRCCSILRRRF